jgi:hypothetical protein
MIIHNPILTGSFTVNGTNVASITSSADSITALNNYTASQNTLNGTYATTSSNTFTGIQTVNSNLVVTGSITAQTLVVQTITSSVDFVTGSTRFGSILSNTHVFSGSVTMNPGGLFVSSSGNVGIGTTSPVNSLDVVKAGTNAIRVQNTTNASDAYYIAQNTSGSAFFGINSTGPYIYTLEALSLQVITNNTERLRVTSAGNVGIGTSSPSSLLDLSIGNNQKIFNMKGATTGYQYMQMSNTSGSLLIGIEGSTPNNIATGDLAYSSVISTANTSALQFGVNQAVSMTLVNGGKVGIGTTNPRGAGGSYNGMEIYGANGASLLLSNGGGSIVYLYIGGSDNNFLLENAGDQIFRAGSAERLRITSAGQLQIKQSGNGYPDGLKLTNTNAAYWIMVNGGDNNLYLGYNASDRGQFNNSTGAYTALSDINKKKDFEESTIGLDAILGLKPTLYRMKVEENTDKHLGFIAQEVKEFIPQAYVESGQEGNKFIGLDYQAITATLVKAIQEQQQQIEELKSLINK